MMEKVLESDPQSLLILHVIVPLLIPSASNVTVSRFFHSIFSSPFSNHLTSALGKPDDGHNNVTESPSVTLKTLSPDNDLGGSNKHKVTQHHHGV